MSVSKKLLIIYGEKRQGFSEEALRLAKEKFESDCS